MGPATTAPGFRNRQDSPSGTPRRRAATSSQLDFYVAFAFWKLACILEGVYARYLDGAMGERDSDELSIFKLQVDRAAEQAAELVL